MFLLLLFMIIIQLNLPNFPCLRMIILSIGRPVNNSGTRIEMILWHFCETLMNITGISATLLIHNLASMENSRTKSLNNKTENCCHGLLRHGQTYSTQYDSAIWLADSGHVTYTHIPSTVTSLQNCMQSILFCNLIGWFRSHDRCLHFYHCLYGVCRLPELGALSGQTTSRDRHEQTWFSKPW